MFNNAQDYQTIDCLNVIVHGDGSCVDWQRFSGAQNIIKIINLD